MSPGSYDVSLTVTDDDGVSNSLSQRIEVTEPVIPSINLVVRKATRKKKDISILRWTGATTRQVDLYVNGTFAGRVNNDGYLMRKQPLKASLQTYQICNRKSLTVCSDVVSPR